MHLRPKRRAGCDNKFSFKVVLSLKHGGDLLEINQSPINYHTNLTTRTGIAERASLH